jgi:hypothetical protein
MTLKKNIDNLVIQDVYFSDFVIQKYVFTHYCAAISALDTDLDVKELTDE